MFYLRCPLLCVSIPLMDVPNGSFLSPLCRESNRDRQNCTPYWMDSVTRLQSTLLSSAAPTQTTALYSITELTGCEPDMHSSRLLYPKDSSWTRRKAAAQQLAGSCL